MRIIKSKILHILLLALIASCGQEDGVAPNIVGGGSGSTADGPCTNNCIIYLHEENQDGNIGGIAGADYICNNNPRYPGSGTFKAMLGATSRRACSTPNCSGGASENIDWVLKPNTTYINVSGSTIGTTTASGIFTFPLTNAIDRGTWSRTGLEQNWTNSTANCQDWTSNNGAHSSTRGSTAYNDSRILRAMTVPCSDAFTKTICVQQ